MDERLSHESYAHSGESADTATRALPAATCIRSPGSQIRLASAERIGAIVNHYMRCLLPPLL